MPRVIKTNIYHSCKLPKNTKFFVLFDETKLEKKNNNDNEFH